MPSSPNLSSESCEERYALLEEEQPILGKMIFKKAAPATPISEDITLHVPVAEPASAPEIPDLPPTLTLPNPANSNTTDEQIVHAAKLREIERNEKYYHDQYTEKKNQDIFRLQSPVLLDGDRISPNIAQLLQQNMVV
jgi:hypothetical protein